MSIETLSPQAESSNLLPEPAPARSTAARFLRNSAANIVRTGLTAVISILLPMYLTHRLPVRVYGAWVLVLQLSAYVGYLNLGVQTAVSKYIAEYEARRDFTGCGKCASSGLRILLIACALGLVLTALLAALVPRLFQELPHELLHDVQVSILLVGASLSIGLASSVFSAIFLGLQRYEVPMLISVGNRALYAAAVCAAVALHRGLILMAFMTAMINLLTSAAEVIAWKKLASNIRVRLFGTDRPMTREMLAYCFTLTIWSACMLFISGLDLTIVGHFAFAQVAFYSIANSPTNLILLIVGALLGPLLPAASALNISSSPTHMGQFLLRSTRYSTVILLATGLPLLVAGLPLLTLWVGRTYALNSILFLQVLLIANIIRNLGAPYSTMVVATSRQKFGTISAVTEAVVNLTCSILLARRYGAIGVAAGTLIGSFAGVALHFAVTMHYTRDAFAVTRLTLFVQGILRPFIMAIPTLLLAARWWNSSLPLTSPQTWVLWSASTCLLTWFISLNAPDRAMLLRMTHIRA